MTDKLYVLRHDETNRTMPWSVFGIGFGIRCFESEEAARNEATDYFGLARMALTVWPHRTRLHILAAPGANPLEVLNSAIAALEAERDALNNCPAHTSLELSK